MLCDAIFILLSCFKHLILKMFYQKGAAIIATGQTINSINKHYNYSKQRYTNLQSNILPHLQFNGSGTSITFLIILLIILINVLVIASTPSFTTTKLRGKNYVQKRYIQCLRTNSFMHNERTECTATFMNENGEMTEELKLADFGRGCYQQFEPKMRSLRYLCPLHCENATESTVISKSPSSNHKCTQFYNYGIVARSTDFYLWRSEFCLNETMEFQIRCTFNGQRIMFRRKSQAFDNNLEILHL